MELLGWLFLLVAGGYAVFNLMMVAVMIVLHKHGLEVVIPAFALSVVSTIIYGLVIFWFSPVSLSLSW